MVGQMQDLPPIPPPVDLDEFVKAALDGAIGGFDAKTLSTQDDAIAAMRRYLAARYHRALTHSECVRLEVAAVCEWNRRALPREVPEAEILAEFDAARAHLVDEATPRIDTAVPFPRAVSDTEMYAFYRNANKHAMRSWVRRALDHLRQIPEDEFEVIYELEQLACLELTRTPFKPEARLLNEAARDILTSLYLQRQLAQHQSGRRVS